MSIVLDSGRFTNLSVAALMIIGGVVSKNSAEQMDMPDHPFLMPLSWFLFFAGWIFLAYVSGQGNNNKYYYYVASFGVMVSVYFMKRAMAQDDIIQDDIIQGEMPNMVFPGIFVMSWLMLGYIVSAKCTGASRYSGLLVSVLIIGSMMLSLPTQRENCVVDGPGMPMFVVAWTMYVMLASME
jgi:hypothetical protein